MTDQTNKIETLLKKPEIKRDEAGRFEQHGKTLAKTSKNTMSDGKPFDQVSSNQERNWGGVRPGAGRPPGARNMVTRTLKEAILAAGEIAGDKIAEGQGGEGGMTRYLSHLAIENSSAFAGLIGKVLPLTIQASESNGGPAVIRFERVIVMPDGTKHIEGKTPKQLPPPVSSGLADKPDFDADHKEINDLDKVGD